MLLPPAFIISNPLEPSVNRDREVDCAVAIDLVSSVFRIFGERKFERELNALSRNFLRKHSSYANNKCGKNFLIRRGILIKKIEDY